MSNAEQVRLPRRQRERGAVAVEAALVLPVVLLLLVAIMEFGLVFKDKLAQTSAVRAGVRTGSAEPRTGSFAQDTANSVARGAAALNPAGIRKMWVYKPDANGYPLGGGSAFSSCTTCVTFRWDSGTKKFVPTSDTWSAATQNACPGDSNHDSIGVYLEVEHPAVTGMIFHTLTLREFAVLTFEPIPVTAGCR